MPFSLFSVTKSDGELIRPYSETPSGTALPLSTIDKIYITGFFIETLHVFNNREGVRGDPAKVLRQALSKALVIYYPMAGRLARAETGEQQVSCTGDGAWFVEASANCSLEDVNWLQHPPLMIPKEQLLSLHPDPAGMILMLQVTRFSCGGFVVGVMSDHTMNDGIGVAQFLNAIADIARGLPEPTVKPVWCREAIPTPPKPSEAPPSPSSPLPINYSSNQYFSIDVSLDCITQLKNRYHEQTGRHCSTFDIMCAKVWQSRAEAMGLDPESDFRLVFAANIRHLVKELPGEGGYYGNCVYPLIVTAKSGKVVDASTVEIVGMIREAKGRLAEEFAKWAKGELKEDPFQPGFSFECIYMADWTRVGFIEVDYGWGKPAFIVPVIDSVPSAVGFIAKLSGPGQGVRLITQCVAKHQLREFQEKMEKFDQLKQ